MHTSISHGLLIHVIADEVISCILDEGREATPPADVILEVEGKQLHANRAVLAHYSPVFARMFYSDFKEKDEKVIPLPGKKYEDMALFFNVLWPSNPGAKCMITGQNLIVHICVFCFPYEISTFYPHYTLCSDVCQFS
jgi:hypothetical protein